MREMAKQEKKQVQEAVIDAMERNGIEGWVCELIDPFLVDVNVPVDMPKRKAAKAFNEIFHALGLLPDGNNMPICALGDYCMTFEEEGGESYCARFNFPCAMEFKKGDEEYGFTIKGILEANTEATRAAEAEMLELVDGIKAGRIKSKGPDGYLVLKGEFYDAIESGKKKVEYREFSEYNLKRTIGIKTIRFNRGYVKNAPQRKWEGKKVVLMDDEDNEFDPFDVPEGSWPTVIAIHLGKRLG